MRTSCRKRGLANWVRWRSALVHFESSLARTAQNWPSWSSISLRNEDEGQRAVRARGQGESTGTHIWRA